MHVNIVVREPDMHWIAGRLARELVARLPKYGVDAAINSAERADLHYHQIVYGKPQPSSAPVVGLFTHGEGRAADNAPFYQGHVALNPMICATLSAAGAPRPVVIEQAVDECFHQLPRPVFGVAGSTKSDGRKGEHLVGAMVEHGYDVRAWGAGWPCPIISRNYNHLPEFYRSLDYYVVTSSDEGGCSPIIECMAMGVPVIAPRIGFAIVRPVLEYQVGSWDSLHRVLRYLTEHRTYDDWARDHANYFKEIAG